MAEERPALPSLPGISILELYKMRGGVIRSEDAALGIARIILANLYGAKTVSDYEPFSAVEYDDKWTVRGVGNPSLSPVIVLSRIDGRVIELDIRLPVE